MCFWNLGCCFVGVVDELCSGVAFMRGVVCLFGLFVCLGCCLFVRGVVRLGGVGGGNAKLFFEKLHAQFAYYKSPELGLNLSGS